MGSTAAGPTTRSGQRRKGSSSGAGHQNRSDMTDPIAPRGSDVPGVEGAGRASNKNGSVLLDDHILARRHRLDTIDPREDRRRIPFRKRRTSRGEHVRSSCKVPGKETKKRDQKVDVASWVGCGEVDDVGNIEVVGKLMRTAVADWSIPVAQVRELDQMWRGSEQERGRRRI